MGAGFVGSSGRIWAQGRFYLYENWDEMFENRGSQLTCF